MLFGGMWNAGAVCPVLAAWSACACVVWRMERALVGQGPLSVEGLWMLGRGIAQVGDKGLDACAEGHA